MLSQDQHVDLSGDSRIKVVILEDIEDALRGFRSRLLNHPNIHVIGAEANLDDFLHIVQDEVPDVAVIDLSIGGSGRIEVGIQAIMRVTHLSPDTRCLVYTAYATPQNFHRAIDAGAKGFLDKEDKRLLLIDAVLLVEKGVGVFTPELVQTIVRHTNQDTLPQELPVLPSEQRYPKPTPQQTKLLRLHQQGLATAQMATTLYCSENTVRQHFKHLFKRWKVHNRDEALAICRAYHPHMLIGPN